MSRVQRREIRSLIYLMLVMLYMSVLPTQAQYGVIGEPNNPSPADGSFHDDTWIVLNWSPGDYAVSYDVYFGDNFNDVNNGLANSFQDNQTERFFVLGFAGHSYPDGLVPGTTYYWRIDEVNDTEPNSPWKGPVWSFSIPPRIAYNPEPADCAESVELDAKLQWAPGFDAKLHTVYFGDNFDDVNDATGGLPKGFTTYYPETLKMAKRYYWRVDEFDGIDTHKGDVWSFFTQGIVSNPNPSNGAVDVNHTPILSWKPGIYADSHQLYFGIDKDAVKNADTGSPEYTGHGNIGLENYDPGKLELDTTYYWRIDEFNNTNSDSPWIGPVWSFTTANFLVVDDFESYNDLSIDEPGSRRIYHIWIDGFDNPNNGSEVGESNPPFVGWTIAHTGEQSMPYYYDNSGTANYSEVTANVANLKAGRDWTKQDIKTLSLWFRRPPESDPWFRGSKNKSEPMYVSLANTNGPTTAVYHDDPNATQVNTWTEWRIDLQEFANEGVDLTNINTISIGFGDRNKPGAGGSGKMFFDNIRLYRPDSQDQTP